MPNHSQFQPQIQQHCIENINQRWSQLYHLQKEWADKAVNFLFLSNSGGAIAMLSFIGAKEGVDSLVVWGLVIMLLGLILVGILVACVYHQMTGLFNAYRKDVKEYFIDRISWEKLSEDDNLRSRDSALTLCIAYGSFACFIIGIALGVWGLLK